MKSMTLLERKPSKPSACGIPLREIIGTNIETTLWLLNQMSSIGPVQQNFNSSQPTILRFCESSKNPIAA